MSLTKTRLTCRLCDSTALVTQFNLAPTPPANEFLRDSEKGITQELFPLDVCQCGDCGHVQLRHVVNPDRLFSHYVYVSGTSPVFINHFKEYAAAARAKVSNSPTFALDIGSNDGTLLKFFREDGWKVLGVDPAVEIGKKANEEGIPTITAFFDQPLAEKILSEHGSAGVITANNVFAHADDLLEILLGVSKVLDERGLFVFEVSYLLDVVEKNLFDTIYHEHVSYHSVKPLVDFMAKAGMQLVDVERVSSHGGSIRCWAQKKQGPYTVSSRVAELIALEESAGLYQADTYQKYIARINQLGADLRNLIVDLQRQGKKVAGFGAPAKATTLMYQFGLGLEHLPYIIDDSPLKQGLYSPGKKVPITPSSVLTDPAMKPDYLVILAWNFATSIMERNAAFAQQGGKFIVPIPSLSVH